MAGATLIVTGPAPAFTTRPLFLQYGHVPGSGPSTSGMYAGGTETAPRTIR